MLNRCLLGVLFEQQDLYDKQDLYENRILIKSKILMKSWSKYLGRHSGAKRHRGTKAQRHKGTKKEVKQQIGKTTSSLAALRPRSHDNEL
jgi:hypothetical protein